MKFDVSINAKYDVGGTLDEEGLENMEASLIMDWFRDAFPPGSVISGELRYESGGTWKVLRF